MVVFLSPASSVIDVPSSVRDSEGSGVVIGSVKLMGLIVVVVMVDVVVLMITLVSSTAIESLPVASTLLESVAFSYSEFSRTNLVAVSALRRCKKVGDSRLGSEADRGEKLLDCRRAAPFSAMFRTRSNC